MVDPQAIREARLQNAISDALAALQAHELSGDAQAQRVMAATTLEELRELERALGLTDMGRHALARVPSDDLWPAIRVLEHELERERDVYGGRYVDDEVLVRIGLVDRVSPIMARLRGTFAYPARLCVFAVEFPLARLEETAARLEADYNDLLDEGVSLLSFGIAVLRNRVTIEVDGDPDRYASDLRARFGPCVVVERGEPALAL